jgi:DNA-binding YbaB/EbfC family protein
MFDKLGGLMNLLANKGKIQEEMARFNERLGQITAEATVGGGYVTVKANGKLEITGCRLSEEVLRLNDREMLEDLIAAAANQALAKVKEQVAAETSKVAANLGLPPGMLGGGGFPGLG